MALYAFVALKYLFPLDRMLQTIDRHRAAAKDWIRSRGRSEASPAVVQRGRRARYSSRCDPNSSLAPMNWTPTPRRPATCTT